MASLFQLHTYKFGLVHFLASVRRPLCDFHYFQRSSSPKPLRRSKPNLTYDVERAENGETKVCIINGPGHMTKKAAPPIYVVKTFQNFLFQNEKSDDLETWHVALTTQVLHYENSPMQYECCDFSLL